MTPALSPEQLLLIAREFCAVYNVRISNFSALVAASAAANARIEGLPVHGSPRAAAHALGEVLRKVEALSGHNREFAALCERVFLALAQD
ncbi:cell filamentation protein Fic [Corynebacterium flavescens]